MNFSHSEPLLRVLPISSRRTQHLPQVASLAPQRLSRDENLNDLNRVPLETKASPSRPEVPRAGSYSDPCAGAKRGTGSSQRFDGAIRSRDSEENQPATN